MNAIYSSAYTNIECYCIICISCCNGLVVKQSNMHIITWSIPISYNDCFVNEHLIQCCGNICFYNNFALCLALNFVCGST